MPRRDWTIRIEDILEAIEAIQSHCAGLDAASFAADRKTSRAVLFELVVIGEAAGHVPDPVVEASPDIDWAQMRAMRNILVHEYFGADLAIVWRTVQEDLPPLVPKLMRLLDGG